MHSLFPVFSFHLSCIEIWQVWSWKIVYTYEWVVSSFTQSVIPFLFHFCSVFSFMFLLNISPDTPVGNLVEKRQSWYQSFVLSLSGWETVKELQIFPNCYAQYFPFFVQHFFLVLVLHLVRHHTRPLLICSRHWSGSGKPNLREPVVNWVPVVIQGGCLVVELIIGCHLHHEWHHQYHHHHHHHL